MYTSKKYLGELLGNPCLKFPCKFTGVPTCTNQYSKALSTRESHVRQVAPEAANAWLALLWKMEKAVLVATLRTFQTT